MPQHTPSPPTTARTRAAIYETLLPQAQALVQHERDAVAVMANLSAALQTACHFFWVGFYIVREEELVLGPFQGPVACSRIKKGKGVCGQAWVQKHTLIVADVHAFPGHIACSPHSRSEIVVPYVQAGKVQLLLDVDSDRLDDFSQTDAMYLDRLLQTCLKGISV